MRRTKHKPCLAFVLCAFLALLLSTTNFAQPLKTYTVKNGKMYIQLPRDIKPAALDSFIVQYDLADLGLKTFLKTAKADSLQKFGWRIDANNEAGIVLSKALEPFDALNDLNEKLLSKNSVEPLFPAVNNGLLFGANRFRNKASFYQGDSIVRFFLRGRTDAHKAVLAGSFNNWNPDQLFMKKTDSGWIYAMKLGAGKYWYKFIVDERWTVDGDNLLSENDGRGNTNSVFFRPNTFFHLSGFTNAKKVFLSGSFNDWKPNELLMKQTLNGWDLPLYLAQGTHAYKFVVDGRWYADPENKEKIPDGVGDYNSVIRLGKPHLFILKGFENSKNVLLAGSFNQWRSFECPMRKTASGWELPYTLGPGNYSYKFNVDDKWISDPANPLSSSASGNSFLIIEPNYTFRLKGMKEAKSVFLTGDFNDWDPRAYPMKKEGDDWVFRVHLFAGKHLYKFVVDGKWIIDPANKLWEQNEFGTGNSIIWMEQ